MKMKKPFFLVLILFLGGYATYDILWGYNIKAFVWKCIESELLGPTIAKWRNFGEYSLPNDHVISTLAHHKLPIVVNRRDRCVCWAIRTSGTWERCFTNHFLERVSEGDVIVEVGANYGYYTLLMADKVGEKGSIYAFEPNPMVHRALSKSLFLNDFDQRVKLYDYAVTDCREKQSLVFNFHNIGGGFLMKNAGDSPHQATVATISLDECLRDVSDVKLLRMDAEGSEIRILPGAEQLIDRSPELVIIMEWSPDLLSRYGDVSSFVDYLVSRGYSFQEMVDNHTITSISPEQLRDNVIRELILRRHI